MRITLVLDSGSRVAGRHCAGELHACVTVRCPHGCAPLDAAHPDVIAVSGVKPRHDHATYYATAIALCCRKGIGSLEVRTDTLFGIDEDNAVLRGRPRVYG